MQRMVKNPRGRRDSSNESAKVSIIIPTYRRHEEVVRAIDSALQQTLAPFEVIVVNDGEDEKKRRLLQEVFGSSIKYLEAPRTGTPSGTRNFGIQLALGEWIALLDDDDVWFPHKLDAQFSALEKSGLAEAIVAGVQVIERDGTKLGIRPERRIPDNTPICQILFGSSGGIHTSTLMAPRWLFSKYPFNESIRVHEDWEWLLCAGRELQVVCGNEPIALRKLHHGEGLTRPGGYIESKKWYERVRGMMTPRARAIFVSSMLSTRAAYDLNLFAVPWLYRELKGTGFLSVRLVVRSLVPWIVPVSIRASLRELKIFDRLRRAIG
jgi:glycosyltransferase involved in cell wall biosynthesis